MRKNASNLPSLNFHPGDALYIFLIYYKQPHIIITQAKNHTTNQLKFSTNS